MALVEPLIGHLLSKYKETVLEGLAKIRSGVQAGDGQGTALATALTQQEEAMQAIRATLFKPDYFVPTTQTLTVVLTSLPERGSRVAFVRDVLRGDTAALFRKTLATLSDATLAHVTAALHFLTAAVKDAPLLVLARLRGPADTHSTGSSGITAPRRADVPLQLAAFRLQLTYSQRRIRLVRLQFLVQLITSPMHNAVAETIGSHGVLTHLLEDAAELLREGTSAGVACALDALRVVQGRFVQSRDITAEQKRKTLLAQRNIFRLLVRALEFEPVADHAAAILYAVVDETIESPADYASTRVESLEDHGMPNYLLFFLLRQLRPKASERMAELMLYILRRAPDLIRPYFIRISGHLAEEGSTHGVAPTTGRVAVINLMTRAFLCPMPYHLAALQVQLEPVAAKTSTFYAMCPRDVADEICPAWVAEYVHRLINGSTNLLLLTLAMQLTQAALMRAQRVLPLIYAAQNAAEAKKKKKQKMSAAEATVVNAGGVTSAANGAPADGKLHVAPFTEADLAALQGSDDADAEAWDTYNAQVRHHLQAALPSREEFWHRMTQQLHRALTATASGAGAEDDAARIKVHVVTQRMLLLMKNYVDVFDVRAPWLSAVPVFLPDLKQFTDDRGAAAGKAKKSGALAAASTHPITVALEQHNDILQRWPAASVALLCELLVVSHQRRVPMVKLHHINMSQAQGVGEWPLLLSVLLWVTHHSPSHLHASAPIADAAALAQLPDVRAAGWAAQLLLWTVHSVTIHSTCTLAEAYLWLSSLTPNTVPVFLHVLNHLLMRSLSKAADRVTHELREAQQGVLVAAAEHFIERTKEKQQQQQTASVDHERESTSTVNAARGGRGGKSQQAKSHHSQEAGTNLWGTHLQAALGDFEHVVAQVRQRWPQRDAMLAAANAAVQLDARTARVTQQQCIDVLVLADRQRGVVQHADRAATSAVQQLRTFARTLHSPVLPLPEEEAEMALLTELHGNRSDKPREDNDEPAVEDGSDSVELVRRALALSTTTTTTATAHETSAETPSPRWYAMSSVCWHVAGRLLSLLRVRRDGGADKGKESEERQSAQANVAAARMVALELLRAVLERQADVQGVLAQSSSHDSSATGLLVLLLTCVRALLPVSSTSAASASVETLSTTERDALAALCLANYTGALSVHDRICYAVCLSLHYLSESGVDDSADAVKEEAEEDGEQEKVGQQRRRQQSHHHHRSSAPHASRTSSTTARAHAEPQHRFRFHGATVPQALVAHRFLLSGHSATAVRTAEVEMVAWHLDTLAEEDILRMALTASSRLHNGLLLHPRRSDGQDGAVDDVLCAVYPELHRAADLHVADLDRLTSGEVLDLRYVVPLLHRVAALPPAYLEHVATGRLIPLLLKALTSVDPALRSTAAAALATLYIPKGALRIVVGVARLKLCQLAAASPSAGSTAETVSSASVVPRLPTPLAIFLITAIRPLGRYEDALHHHLVHFLVHIEHALAAPVPFVRWTHTPPLTAISVPLMLEKQEALQQRTHKLGGSGHSSSIAQASAADVAQELRRGIPPQLEFILRLLRHACETADDGAALLESNGVSGLMLLSDLLTASDNLRATYVRALLDLCTQSVSLTRYFALHANALPWAVTFLSELCTEYGTKAPYPYAGLTFTTALQLLRVLLTAVLDAEATEEEAGSVGSSASPSVSAATIAQLGETLRLLRACVVDAHVTARDTLDAFDDMMNMCARSLRHVCKESGEAHLRSTAVVTARSGESGKRGREKLAPGDVAKKSGPKKRVKTEQLKK